MRKWFYPPPNDSRLFDRYFISGYHKGMDNSVDRRAAGRKPSTMQEARSRQVTKDELFTKIYMRIWEEKYGETTDSTADFNTGYIKTVISILIEGGYSPNEISAWCQDYDIDVLFIVEAVNAAVDNESINRLNRSVTTSIGGVIAARRADIVKTYIPSSKRLTLILLSLSLPAAKHARIGWDELLTAESLYPTKTILSLMSAGWTVSAIADAARNDVDVDLALSITAADGV